MKLKAFPVIAKKKKEHLYDGVIFDLDGTLTDSGEGITHCAEKALNDLGISAYTRQDLRYFVGPPLRDSFIKAGVPPEKTDEAVCRFRTYYRAFGAMENRLYEGIDNLLGQLKDDGFQLYVATSKPENMAVTILEAFHIASFFMYTAGASEDLSRQTKEEVLRYLLAEMNGVARPVLIGDTIYDVTGAAEVGIPCIGVSWGYGDIDAMGRAGAAAIVESVEQLYKILTDR